MKLDTSYRTGTLRKPTNTDNMHPHYGQHHDEPYDGTDWLWYAVGACIAVLMMYLSGIIIVDHL